MIKVRFYAIASLVLIVAACNTSSNNHEDSDQIKEYYENSAAGDENGYINNIAEDSVDINLCTLSYVSFYNYMKKAEKDSVLRRYESLLDAGHGINCMCPEELSHRTLGSYIPIVKDFVKKYKYDGIRYITPMHIIAGTGNTELMQLLVSKGADINKQDGEERYPIDVAIFTDNRDMVDFLIINGADISKADLSFVRDFKYLKKLLDQGGNPKTINMGYFIENRSQLEQLMKYGPELNKYPMYSIWFDDEKDNVKYLLDNGMSPLAPGKSVNDPVLFEAIDSYDKDFAIMMTGYLDKEDIRKINTDAFTEPVILYAAKNDRWDIVKVLIDKGVNPNRKGSFDETPLFCAIDSLNYDMVTLLVSKGADLETPCFFRDNKSAYTYADSKNDPALMKAIRKGRQIK
ncbi:MAG: ankyrin repeat domain-containing protein [Bacteroidota bacterium]